MEYLLNLCFSHLRFYFKAVDPIHLPWYKGATFRGLFGRSFKNLVCFQTHKDCRSCAVATSCAYYYVFETPNKGELSDFSSEKVPQPFVLTPPLTNKRYFRPSDLFCMDLVIIGNGIDYLPYFVYVFDEMGRKRGIGKWIHEGFGKYELEKVTEINDQEENLIYHDQKILSPSKNNGISFNTISNSFSENSLLMINFITPTRLNHGGLIEKDNNKKLTFSMLIQDIAWRIHLLLFFHQDKTIPPYEQSEAVPMEVVQKNFKWNDWFHYSNRHKKRIPSGGFLGSIVFRGKWHAYYPLIKLGEKVHVGKMTTFGMGKFAANVIDSA